MLRQSQAQQPTLSEGKTTLGMVIKLCAQRYYEVFDEVRRLCLCNRLFENKVQCLLKHLRPLERKQQDGLQNVDDEDMVLPYL
jgi:hypothetical protein